MLAFSLGVVLLGISAAAMGSSWASSLPARSPLGGRSSSSPVGTPLGGFQVGLLRIKHL